MAPIRMMLAPVSPKKRPAGHASSGHGHDKRGSAKALHWSWVKITLVLILSFEPLLLTSEAAHLKHGDMVFTRRDVALIKSGFTKGDVPKRAPGSRGSG